MPIILHINVLSKSLLKLNLLGTIAQALARLALNQGVLEVGFFFIFLSQNDEKLH